jgi:N-methylhydantoinase A
MRTGIDTGGYHRVGIDTGGTFTDIVRFSGEGIAVYKVPSTPDDPGRAVDHALAGLGTALPTDRLIHGTTVATNALLTRSAAPVALLTTKGFRDVLTIGRQARPDLYALEPEREASLIGRRHRFEISERTLFDGTVETRLDEEETRRVAARLARDGIRSVAVCFLHSYANPGNERRAAAILRKAGFRVTASHEVLPEYREYERFATTAVNAYVGPVVSDYLTRLSRRVGPDRLAVMQSNGGIVSWRAAVKAPVRTVLSGPAGGVVAALETGRTRGVANVISFDMGGTSTDVALISGAFAFTTEFAISGLPVALPVLDILTVGAGGGSIARVDAGGALTVGPESAGAVPGPACYGRGGGEVTVTDAHVLLGRIPPDRFLGGRMRLDPELVTGPFDRLSKAAGMSPVETALGVLRVAEVNMERAIRRISLERGHDPADFSLVSFGGAGSLHAARLAESLGIAEVIVPPDPGAFSAAGMARADVVQDRSLAVLRPLGPRSGKELRAVADRLAHDLSKSMARDGIADPCYAVALDLRYAGQSFEITVDWPEGAAPAMVAEAFAAAHERLYGARHPDRAVTVVAVRVRAVGEIRVPPAARHPLEGRDPSRARDGTAPAYFREGRLPTAFFSRDRLRAGHRIEGPAVITEATATTVVPPGHRARVDELLNLVITREEP